MAAYLGVPVHTLRKWVNGTRKPDAAPMRLFAVLKMIEIRAPGLHADLVADTVPDGAAESAPVPAKRAGRASGKPAPVLPAWAAPASPEPLSVPDWLMHS